MVQHANPRFYVGPETNELILVMGRAFGVRLNNVKPSIFMDMVQRSPESDLPELTWVAYAMDSENRAHFQIPDEFISNIDQYPAAFYDCKVRVDDCHVADVELIKAPGHYAVSGQSVQESCVKQTTWIEPDCPIEIVDEPCGCDCNGDIEAECECIYQVRNNCPTCYNSVHVVTANISEGYVQVIPGD